MPTRDARLARRRMYRRRRLVAGGGLLLCCTLLVMAGFKVADALPDRKPAVSASNSSVPAIGAIVPDPADREKCMRVWRGAVERRHLPFELIAGDWAAREQRAITLVTVLLARIILKEHFTRWKTVGMVAALLAVPLIAG